MGSVDVTQHILLGNSVAPGARRGRSCAATSTWASRTREARAVVGANLAEGYRGTGFQLLVGNPDAVVESLCRYRKTGFDYVMVRHVVGDHQLMLRSFERIGREVMPRIRGL